MAIRNYEIVAEDFHNFLEGHIQGGTIEYPMDADWIEEQGVMSAEEYDFYERELCILFDNHYFQCNSCGWTLPIEDMADNDNWECTDCEVD